MPDTTTTSVCGSTSPIGDHACVLAEGHQGLHANKPLADITPNGSRIVWKLDADEGFCGDEYDGEDCELEPGHAGAHISGNLAWSYGRSTNAYRTA